MTEDSTGLMAFWATIDEDYLNRFREWHNCEHMPERVSIPGFQAGRRYIDCGDPATYLMTYQTRDTAVLGSQPYLDALNAPSEWTRESLPHFNNPVRNIYTRLAAYGETNYVSAPYVYALRFNADAEELAEAAASLAGNEQLGQVALYRVDEAISGIQTSERKIYGGGPGEQRWLLLVEATLAGATDSSALTGRLASLAADWQDVFQGLFAIDYVLAKP
jgi:hypothetical protein